MLDKHYSPEANIRSACIMSNRALILKRQLAQSTAWPFKEVLPESDIQQIFDEEKVISQ